jgi:hypothetical protein
MPATAASKRKTTTGKSSTKTTSRKAQPVKTQPANTSTMSTPPRKRVNFADVQKGDLMGIVTFVKVTSKGAHGILGRTDSLQVRNIDNGMDFQVQGAELVEQMFSADRFLSTEELSKTALAEKLITLYNRPFTVTFDTQDGTERTMRARYISHEELLGRSRVIDLDADPSDNFRLVDHRTLKEIIVDGVQFKLKKK